MVTSTIKKHLVTKQAELIKLSQKREKKKDLEGAELEAEKLRIQTLREEAEEQYQEVKRLISDDDQYRDLLLKKEAMNKNAELEKVSEKLSMDDAARFI